MDFSHSPKTQEYLTRVNAFINEHIAPIEAEVYEFSHEKNAHDDWHSWQLHPQVEALKATDRSIHDLDKDTTNPYLSSSLLFIIITLLIAFTVKQIQGPIIPTLVTES